MPITNAPWGAAARCLLMLACTWPASAASAADVPADAAAPAASAASATSSAASASPATMALLPALVKARLNPSRCPMLAIVSGNLGRHEHGYVTVRVHVGANGEVEDTELVRFETRESTARDAASGLRDCAFEPARRGGTPVASTLTVDLKFGKEPQAPPGIPGPNGSHCDRVFSPRVDEPVKAPTRMLLHFRPDGTVSSVDLVQSSGVRAADDAGMDTARSCVADPAGLAAKGLALQPEAPMAIDWAI